MALAAPTFNRATQILRLGLYAVGVSLLPLVFFGLAMKAPAIAARFAQARPHAFDAALFALQPLVLKLHIALAIISLALGAWMMLSRKGARAHRIAGWSWVVSMGGMMVSSLFVVSTNHGHWSYIHITSVTGLILLTVAVAAARRHEVQSHSRSMRWLYFGWLIGAGLFTFIPGRLMWAFFLG